MENTLQTEKQKLAERQLHDAYNDEYWSKTYGVSAEELKETKDGGLSEKIIEINVKNNTFHN